MAVPQHLALGGGHGLQRLDGRLGLALLHHAQHRVQQHHHQDDEHLREALATEGVGHGGHRRRRQQDKQHGVLQLRQEPLQQGGFLRLLQLIGAVLLQPPGRLLFRQTGRGGTQRLQHLLRAAAVFFLHSPSLLYRYFFYAFSGAVVPARQQKRPMHGQPMSVHESHSFRTHRVLSRRDDGVPRRAAWTLRNYSLIQYVLFYPFFPPLSREK